MTRFVRPSPSAFQPETLPFQRVQHMTHPSREAIPEELLRPGAYGRIAARVRMARSLPPYSMRPMNITIHAQEPVDARVRAYVEYRMFSAISRFGSRCAQLDVRLDSTQPGIWCALTLDLKPAGRVRVRATADRLYAAIDRSAERLLRSLERRLRAGSFEPRPIGRT